MYKSFFLYLTYFLALHSPMQLTGCLKHKHNNCYRKGATKADFLQRNHHEYEAIY